MSLIVYTSLSKVNGIKNNDIFFFFLEKSASQWERIKLYNDGMHGTLYMYAYFMVYSRNVASFLKGGAGSSKKC